MTTPRDGLLQAAVALAPATVLRRLADAADPGERPEVRGQDVVLLVRADGGQLAYALLANVVATRGLA